MSRARILFVAAFASITAHAAPDLASVLTPLAQQKTTYIDRDWRAPIIPAAPDQRQLQAEAAYLKQRRRECSVADNLLVARENSAAASDLVTDALGAFASFPHTHTLIRRATKDSSTVTAKLLLAYQLPRPCDVDSDIRPPIQQDPVYAYPSGFAINAILTLRILEACAQHPLPATKQKVQLMVDRRLVAGLEWPSALPPAQTIANEMAAEMLRSPEIRAQLELARAEWAKR